MKRAVAVIQHATFIRARRRVQIALCILEDGFYDLLTTEDIARLLSSAISDLEDAQMVEPESSAAIQAGGLNWNDYPALANQ
jgi:hypothetical protein